MSRDTRSSVASGTLWSAIDRFGVVLLQFVVNLMLARLLMPSDFGLVGMILIFVALSQTLVDGGFGAALIHKVDASSVDYSTIFFWNILFAITLYVGVFISAHWVSEFFRIELLETLLPILGTVIVINSLTIVQRAILRKNLNFRAIAIADILSYGGSAVVAVVMASVGCGVWSFVGMYLSNALFSVLLFWSLSPWRPTPQFSFFSFQQLLSYGGFLLVASIMQDLCTHIQGVVIGRRFSALEMGLYAQAKKMDEVASMTVPAVLCQVLFPIYSQLQSDARALCSMLGRNIRMVAFVIFPLMMMLIIVAEPLFLWLYGEQWVGAVFYFQILCIGGFFSALYNFSYYAVAAVGRSRELFFWGCYKWGMLLILLLVGASVSMLGVLVAMVVSNVNIWLTNSLLSQRYIGYRVAQQFRDVAPALVISIISGGVMFGLYRYLALHWVVCCLLFMLFYVGVAWVCGLSVLRDIRNFVVSYKSI